MKKQNTVCLLMIGLSGLFFWMYSSSLVAEHVVVVPLGKKKCTSPMENSFTNTYGMTFNLIPARTFTMGSSADEPGGLYPDEQPEHQVPLSKSFYMQTTEVTQAQWDAVITNKSRGISPSNFPGEGHPVERVNRYQATSFANWLSYDEGLVPCYIPNGSCSGTLGVDFTCITSSITINQNCTGYRLPIEAEWEYAARASTTTAWAYVVSYDDSVDPGEVTGYGFHSKLDALGWYEFNNEGGDLSRTAAGYPSGTKNP